MSTPRVGWPAKEHIRVAGDLAADDDLLLVAAGEPGRRKSRQGRTHIESGDDPRRLLHHRASPQPRPPVVAPVPVIAENAVLGCVELRHQAHALPILRDMGKAQPAHGPRRVLPPAAVRGPPVDADRAAMRGPHAGDGLEQFGLPVTGDARHADDLPRGAP